MVMMLSEVDCGGSIPENAYFVQPKIKKKIIYCDFGAKRGI